MPTPLAIRQRLSGHVEKPRVCADIPDCHRHDPPDSSGTGGAERRRGADVGDDERELSVNDLSPDPSRSGGGVKQAARREEHHDWHEEQWGEPSGAAEGHAAKSI